MSVFSDPDRKSVHLRTAFQGLPHTGKTYSALLFARGLVGPEGKIAVVDCEGGEVDIYKDVTQYQRVIFEPPYTPERYMEYIKAAEDEGFDAVILDTISHEWAGEGGMLEAHDELEKQLKSKMSSYSAWGEITPRHNRLFGAMIKANIHVIVTIRSKPAYVIDCDGGMNKPRRVALGPVQRDMADYEFSMYFEMDDSHTATVKKDRTGVIGDYGTVFQPSIETGRVIRDWLNGVEAKAPVISVPVPAQKKEIYSQSQVDHIKETYKEKGWNQSVFVTARNEDGLYDADVINRDYKQRDEVDKKKVSVKPKTVKVEKSQQPLVPSTSTNDCLCDVCGEVISKMQYDTSYLYGVSGKHLCKSCQVEESVKV